MEMCICVFVLLPGILCSGIISCNIASLDNYDLHHTPIFYFVFTDMISKRVRDELSCEKIYTDFSRVGLSFGLGPVRENRFLEG